MHSTFLDTQKFYGSSIGEVIYPIASGKRVCLMFLANSCRLYYSSYSFFLLPDFNQCKQIFGSPNCSQDFLNPDFIERIVFSLLGLCIARFFTFLLFFRQESRSCEPHSYLTDYGVFWHLSNNDIRSCSVRLFRGSSK